MSTTAIDTARTTERLSAFMSEIAANKPVDNYFPRIPAIEELMKNKKMINGGRQIVTPIDSGNNTTVKDFSDYDVFDTSAQNTALTLTYPMVNKGASVVISWEEMRETAGSDHQIFDLVTHKRDNVMKSLMDAYDTDLFQTSQSNSKISALPIVVLASGATGGLNQSTDSDWASTVTASGSFPDQGLDDMRNTWNTIADNGADPTTIITTPTVYNLYEGELDPDVRYNTVQTADRKFRSLMFNGVPVIRDKKCNSGVLYMLNNENLHFYVDTEGNFKIDPFKESINQKAFVALVTARVQLVCNRRKSLGKLTGITT